MASPDQVLIIVWFSAFEFTMAEAEAISPLLSKLAHAGR
jgi:uncharacterized membrane protein YkgB